MLSAEQRFVARVRPCRVAREHLETGARRGAGVVGELVEQTHGEGLLRREELCAERDTVQVRGCQPAPDELEDARREDQPQGGLVQADARRRPPAATR